MGTGATAAGGASLLGSGAFTSVAVERSVNINIAGDANAFLRLAPCKGSGNGDYVTGAQNGAMSIDLSDSNQDAGDGVNPEALTRIDNIFEICNQGTQNICVDFEITVPEIKGKVPDGYDFEKGDPAVIFHRGSDRDAFVSTEGPNTDRPGAISLPLNNGTCECIGMEIRSFGFSDEDLFADTDLTIVAEAGADCTGAVDPDPGAPGPSPEGLVGYWPLDTDSAEDRSGNGNDGTVIGDVSSVEGQVSSAASFSTPDQYIEVPPIQIEGSLTVTAWILRRSNSKYHAASTQGSNNNDTRNWWLGGKKGGDQVHWSLFDESGTNRRMDSKSGSLPRDEFTHISGVYDAASEEMQIYVDGKLNETTEASFTPATSDDPGAIGAELTDGSPTDPFDGNIDDVRVYNRALSESEIKAIYDATK
jgi:hypothetical protein